MCDEFRTCASSVFRCDVNQCYITSVSLLYKINSLIIVQGLSLKEVWRKLVLDVSDFASLNWFYWTQRNNAFQHNSGWRHGRTWRNKVSVCRLYEVGALSDARSTVVWLHYRCIIGHVRENQHDVPVYEFLYVKKARDFSMVRARNNTIFFLCL